MDAHKLHVVKKVKRFWFKKCFKNVFEIHPCSKRGFTPESTEVNIGKEDLQVSSNIHNKDFERHVLKAPSFPSDPEASEKNEQTKRVQSQFA